MKNNGLKVTFLKFRMTSAVFVRYNDATDPVGKLLVQRWGKKRPTQVLYHNSALHYAIALNFCRNTNGLSLSSNLYNLASMLLCNVFWKPFHI